MMNREAISTDTNFVGMSRLEYVDSLRGVSALLVVFSHAFQSLTFNDYFINIGKVGVFIFFMISGFVIPYSLKKESNCSIIFITTRFFRLYPAYWFSLIFAIAIYYLLSEPIPTINQILSNITMLQMGMGQENIIGVYWTLFIELIFYIICIGLAKTGFLWNERKMVLMFYVFISCSILTSLARFMLHKKIPVPIPLGLSLMFLGYAWRACVIDKSVFVMSKIKTMVAICMVSTFLCGYLSYSWDTQTDEPWKNFSYAYTLGIVCFIVFTKYAKINTKITAYFGVISYSLYLIHEPTIKIVSSLKILTDSIGSEEVRLISIFVALLFSVIVYNTIEKPSIKIGKKIVKKIRISHA